MGVGSCVSVEGVSIEQLLGLGVVEHGKATPASRLPIDAADRGLLYGLGLFETTRLIDDRPWLWHRHLARLQNSAQALRIDVGAADLPSSDAIFEFVAALRKTRQLPAELAIRCNASAGPAGGRPLIWVLLRAAKPWGGMANVTRSAHSMCANDLLARHKTFNYGLRHLAHVEALTAGCDDALIGDDQGNLCEAAHSNVFARFGNRWRTPPTAQPVLPGTVRALLLEHGLLPSLDEATISMEEISCCDEMFLTNSSSGIVAIGQVYGRSLAISNALGEWATAIRTLQ